jgi:toxin HigB-1
VTVRTNEPDVDHSICIVYPYHDAVLVACDVKHRATILYFQGIARPAKRRLEAINAAHLLDDLLVPPSNRLEKLKGNLKGFFSIRINDQWRVIFKWVDGDAYEVRVVDYH